MLMRPEYGEIENEAMVWGREREEEEEEEIYLAQTQQIKCKYKSYTIQLSRVTGKPEGQLCRPP